MSGDQERNEEFQQALNESARLLSQGRPGEAVALLRPLAKAAPANVDVAINLGGAFILQRKWSQAVRVLRQALEHHPDNAMLWANLGAAELGQLELSGPKQQEKSIAAYERALLADAAAPNVHYHLGLIYKHRGEINRASAFFQRALEVQPHDRDAAYWLRRLNELAENPPGPAAPPRRSASNGGNGFHVNPLLPGLDGSEPGEQA